MYWFTCVLLVSFLYSAIAKPTQPEPAESSPPNRRMDTLAGMTIGTNKATRSTRGYPPRSLDSLGDANYLRSVDSIEGQSFERSMESLRDVLRDLDPEFVARLEQVLGYGDGRAHRGGFQLVPVDPLELRRLDYRTLDSLGGANLLRSVYRPSRVGPIGIGGGGSPASKSGDSHHNDGKRLDSLSGLTLGLQKRTFDEVDRTAFDGFNKRDFDEVDRAFDGFSKRNVRSVRD